MSRARLLGSCEVTINSTLKRLTKIEGQNKKALEDEFREWLDAIKGEDRNYDVLYINKIIC